MNSTIIVNILFFATSDCCGVRSSADSSDVAKGSITFVIMLLFTPLSAFTLGGSKDGKSVGAGSRCKVSGCG